MTTIVLRLPISIPQLVAFGTKRGLVSRSGDNGYCLHVLLTSVFGKAAPSPFRVMYESRAETITLLAYGKNLDDLNSALSLPPLTSQQEEARSLLGLTENALSREICREMPTMFSVGKKLRFDVRLRPVVRSRQGSDRARERDIALVEIERGERMRPADEVYGDWCYERLLAAGVKPLQLRLSAKKRTAVIRRSRRMGDEGLKDVEGPDVTCCGLLEVHDPGKFSDAIRSGIGRHRSFGFGMLLLRPV